MTNGIPSEALAGSWIVDMGSGQVKVLATYTPLGGGKYAAVENSFNFDWTLGGSKPTATHATTLNGTVEVNEDSIDFVLIEYVLDQADKAVYIMKAVGNKVLKDKDTISVENVVFHVYNNPETANPVTDESDFCIPPQGTLPPILEYRISVRK